MSYSAPPTWAAGPWTFSDANTYIRDNFNSVHNYQQSKQVFFDTATVTTSLSTIGTHSALCPVAPSDNSRLLVIVALDQQSGGSATYMQIAIYDQAAALFGEGNALRVAGTNFWVGSAIGGTTVAAGTNPGFSIKAQVDTNQATSLTFRTMVLVSPV